MRLQIDTEAKTIRVEESIVIKDLMNGLRKLFPNGEWKEYKLETNCTIYWSNPIVIEPYRPYTWPWTSYPPYQYDTNPCIFTSSDGIYNIQC